MSTIHYANLADPSDTNFATYAALAMFGKGLIREGGSTLYEITGREGIKLEFAGTDFVYNAKGALVSGHATSFQIKVDGEVHATVTDVNISAGKLKGLNTPKEFLALLGKAHVTGSDHDDIIMTGAKNDILNGGDGDDVLIGDTGKNKLFGGDGDDVLFFSLGRDVLNGGAGTDLATFGFGLSDTAGAASGLTIDLREVGFQKVADGISIKLTSIENLLGWRSDDRLTGDAQANLLVGGDGHDTLIGGTGDDTIYGGAGKDVVDGGDGYDTLNFESAAKGVQVSLAKSGVQNTGEGKDKIAGIEKLTGSYHNDKLTGDANSNRIEGGNGDDTITGGGGIDGLVGGSGADTFVFNKASIGAKSDILDFEKGRDLMDLSKIDANALVDGNQDFTFIEQAAFTGVAGQLSWSYFGNDPSRDILVSGDLNGDKVVDFMIQLRSPVAALGASDFDF